MSRQVVLIDPYWTRDKDPRVPLGHASLVAALRTAGVDVLPLAVAVNDVFLNVPKLAETVLEACHGRSPAEVDVAIGAYVWGEAVVQELLSELRARGLRNRIILGGPQISHAGPGLERAYPEADAFVRGYGEDVLVALAQAPGRPRLRGVHYPGEEDRCEQAQVDLARLASPYLTGALPIEGLKFVRWETQRGCPFRCSFCQHREAGAALKRRTLSEDRVSQEIDLLCRADVAEIAVLDPCFNQGKRATEILERFAECGFGGRLSLQCRAELTPPGFLDAAQALEVRLEFGLQTIHDSESEAIRRRNDIAHIERVLADVRRRAIEHEVSLIFGLPGQTLESFLESVRWCIDRGVQNIKAFPLLLLRGTPLDRERARWGFVDEGGAMPMAIESATFSQADWAKMSALSGALRLTEGRHPATIRDLLALAEGLSPELGRWQAPVAGRRAA